MNIEKQMLLISYMISNDTVFTRTNCITNALYFDPRYRKTVQFVKKHYDTYRTSPNHDQVLAETGVAIDQRELTLAEIDYACNELETFCRYQAVEKAVLDATSMIEEENHAELVQMFKDAVEVSLNKDIGLDYFADPEERLHNMLLHQAMISTGWPSLDQALNGGLNRKEMTLFAASSGVGKSITMMNLAVNFVKQNMNVLYVTLELSEDVVAKRFDSMMTGVEQSKVFENIHEISDTVKNKSKDCGKLTIKRLPESMTNANDIRAFLKEYETLYGMTPDIMLIDYLDLMTTNHKVSVENVFVKDKYVAEELRSIANDFDLILVSASQLGRSAIDATEHFQSHIAGGMSKVNTTDNLIFILQSEVQKAAGEYIFDLLKTRSSAGVGTKLPMDFDCISLLITDPSGTSGSTIQLKKKSDTTPNKTKSSLLDLMDFDD